jgi:tetratricopeptide (TPR) repeat protein
VADVLQRIAEKVKGDDLDGAAREADAGIARWESEEAERREASIRNGVILLEAGVKQDLLSRDPVSAARRIARIVALEHGGEPDFDALRARQDDWYVRGRDQGLNLDLAVAIEIARLSCAIATAKDQKGTALNDLGNALATLGGRESGTARLTEAVEAYRAALEEMTRERVPLQWATTQNNLGNALQTLGERESGTARLAEAVEAYRAALKERTRQRVPLDWAQTQNNLGWALKLLGERTRDAAMLGEGKAAVQAAWDLHKSAGYDQFDGYYAKRLAAIDAALAAPGQK